MSVWTIRSRARSTCHRSKWCVPETTKPQIAGDLRFGRLVLCEVPQCRRSAGIIRMPPLIRRREAIEIVRRTGTGNSHGKRTLCVDVEAERGSPQVIRLPLPECRVKSISERIAGGVSRSGFPARPERTMPTHQELRAFGRLDPASDGRESPSYKTISQLRGFACPIPSRTDWLAARWSTLSPSDETFIRT